MSTTYIISIGYNSGFSCKHDDSIKDKSWELLKSVVNKICSDPNSIVEEARRFNAPEEEIDECTLENCAARYELPWNDMTIYFNEEEKLVVQCAAGSREIKEHIRRAFCRLVLQEMHKHNIEINLTVV